MNKRHNNSTRASTLRISLSVSLISVSAILLVIAAPTYTKTDPRQITVTSPSSSIARSAPVTGASRTTTPTQMPCGKIASGSDRDGNPEIYVMNAVMAQAKPG